MTLKLITDWLTSSHELCGDTLLRHAKNATARDGEARLRASASRVSCLRGRLKPNGRLHHLLLTAFQFGLFLEENYVFPART